MPNAHLLTKRCTSNAIARKFPEFASSSHAQNMSFVTLCRCTSKVRQLHMIDSSSSRRIELLLPRLRNLSLSSSSTALFAGEAGFLNSFDIVGRSRINPPVGKDGFGFGGFTGILTIPTSTGDICVSLGFIMAMPRESFSSVVKDLRLLLPARAAPSAIAYSASFEINTRSSPTTSSSASFIPTNLDPPPASITGVSVRPVTSRKSLRNRDASAQVFATKLWTANSTEFRGILRVRPARLIVKTSRSILGIRSFTCRSFINSAPASSSVQPPSLAITRGKSSSTSLPPVAKPLGGRSGITSYVLPQSFNAAKSVVV